MIYLLFVELMSWPCPPPPWFEWLVAAWGVILAVVLAVVWWRQR